MKKTLVILLIVISQVILISKIQAQQGWFVQQSPLPYSPIDIFFIDAQTGWICSDSGRVLKTTNGGTNWTLYSANVVYTLNAIKFINAQTGWTAGGMVNYPGFGMDYAVILKTTNGGINWVTQFYDTWGPRFYDLAIADGNNVFAIGYGSDISGMASKGICIKTSNSGLNWISESFPGGYGLRSIYFTNPQTGWVYGLGTSDVPPAFRVIFRTTNTGYTWGIAYRDTIPWIGQNSKLSFPDATTGYFLDGMLKKTTNGGINWIKKDSANTTAYNLYFYNKDTGWVCGNAGGNFIRRTNNGGENWVNQYTPSYINKLFFANQNTGWGINTNQKVLIKTITGGASIEYLVTGTVKYADNNQPVTSGLVKAIKLNKTNGSIIVLDSANIQSNGTYTLSHVPQDSLDIGLYPTTTPPNDYINSYYPSTIYWQEATVLYPAGNLTNINIGAIRMSGSTASNSVNGRVMRLTDAVTATNLKDANLYARNGNTFVRCAVSDVNGVYHLNSLPSGNLKIIINRLGFTGDSTNVNVTATSNTDSINFYLNKLFAGVKQISGNIPSEYILYQNYPNPFNPSTTIRYSISRTVFVKLAVYDLMGREVNILVKEKQSAGTYEAVWLATNFPSGVYFYRIKAGDYSETKRLILLK
jgi:photosystem II stability/assembly factor-like uncharacterized protein